MRIHRFADKCQVGSCETAVTLCPACPLEQKANLALVKASVAAEGSGGTELANLRPASDRLRVDAEERSDLRGREQFVILCGGRRGHGVSFRANRFRTVVRTLKRKTDVRSRANL